MTELDLSGDGTDPAPPARYYNESLARGLRILQLFGENSQWLSLSEVGRMAGLSPATAHRLLSTLAQLGFIERSPTTRKYRPGLSVLKLGYSALQASDIHALARPYLERLADDTGETVNMGVLAGNSVLYVQRIERHELVTADIHVGSTLPAYATSIGKLLLAFLSDEDLRTRITGTRLVKYGPNTIGTRAALIAALGEIRSQGWAYQDEETAVGLRSIAAPIRNRGGEVAAGINIAVAASRMSLNDLVKKLLPVLRETAFRISALSDPTSQPYSEELH